MGNAESLGLFQRLIVDSDTPRKRARAALEPTLALTAIVQREWAATLNFSSMSRKYGRVQGGSPRAKSIAFVAQPKKEGGVKDNILRKNLALLTERQRERIHKLTELYRSVTKETQSRPRSSLYAQGEGLQWPEQGHLYLDYQPSLAPRQKPPKKH